MSDFKNIQLQTRLSDSLLLFYIALASNFLVNFFPKTHMDFVKNNIFAKYLLGFLTMLFSIYHVSTLQNPFEIIIIALCLFLWFLMTTHLPPMFNIIIITSLAIAFLINIKIYNLELANYNNETREKINKMKTFVMVLFSMIIIGSIVGYFYYLFF